MQKPSETGFARGRNHWTHTTSVRLRSLSENTSHDFSGNIKVHISNTFTVMVPYISMVSLCLWQRFCALWRHFQFKFWFDLQLLLWFFFKGIAAKKLQEKQYLCALRLTGTLIKTEKQSWCVGTLVYKALIGNLPYNHFAVSFKSPPFTFTCIQIRAQTR